MDMKKISKPRMDDYDYERKQRREREKSERQQVQTSSSNREVALFSEPRRVNPSEDDDKIAAKLGDYSKVKDFINLYTVGISNSGHRQMPANAILPGIVPTSSPLPNVSAVVATASSSMGSSSAQRLLPPPAPQSQQQSQQPPHHYQQQQQQLRQIPYVKQADNKPPYNGRGGYPGQPVNRLSSGMAPPKGPPSGNLLPPATTHMPNGRQTSSASSIEKSFLGPPTAVSSSSSATHNGRFSQPSIPKQRQKPLPPENDIKEIINHVTNTFCPPKMLTGIDATPHNTLIENYNLSEKNKHKYSFDILAKTSIVEPLDSPPRMQMPAPRFVPPSSNSSINQMPFSKSTSNICSSSAATSSSSTYIAPVINTTASAGNLTSSTSSSSGQSSSIISNAAKTSPTISHSPILSRPSSKDTLIKSLKIEKPTPLLIEKHNSTLENDLELSDSDDDRKKQNCSTVNSSDSSPSDSSESGSDSSRSESHQSAAIPAAHQLINQQQKMGPVMTSKKKLGSGSIAGSGSSSSGLGSSAPPSGGSSSSSSNKTPSPSNTTKWQLSRYFNKAPLHQTPTQDVVSPSTTSMVNSVNSVNVANLNMPITLRGGAQIIPEPPQHIANIKNESIMEDVDDDGNDNNGNEVDDDKIRGRNKVGNKSDTFPHPAFPSRKAPAGLSVTPLSPIMSDIKKEISTPHVGIVVNQQQMPILNASEFVSIPSTQIKHENMSIGRGHTTVTYGGDVIEGLSNLSSDSNSNDEERIPVRGPGGTLQIPGVPAAITALPRSPPEVQKTQLLNNSVTMIRLDPLNSTATTHLARPPPPQSRAKKPRKKLKQQTSATVAPDTSDEEQDDLTKHRLVNPIANVAVGGKTSISATGPKKGRGRPRKTTPNQSGNISSTSSVSASAKGPTLTAKKDISKKPALTNAVSATARRRTSRLHSSVSSAQDLPMPTKQIHIPTSSADNLPTTQLITPVVPIKEQLITATATATATATSDDSSSSTESSSCSISKSSSSDSDTEIEGSTNKRTIITNSSSSGDDGIKRRSINNKFSGGGEHKVAPPKRIVKKLNTRKSSLEDLPTQLTSTNKSYILTSSSSSSSSESSIEDSSYLPNALTLFGGLSQQPAPIVSGGSSSQRLINHQSPHKVASAFFSESSGEDRSDSDSGQIQKEKKLKRDKPKSDKNKISTLTRIFKSSNEGGAKKQGQVLIVDQSEDQQQQQKHISPALRLSQDNLSAVNNSLQNTTQSPRLTPSGQMISPRSFNMTPLASQVLATSAVTTHRTPDRSTTSAERKLQHRIKTPTRTPTRTPPTTRTPTPTPAVAAASVAHHALTNPLPLSSTTSHILQQQPSTPLPPPPPTSLICKIDLSRLLNVPMEWQANTYRLYGHAPGQQQNRLTPSAGRTPIYDHETILNADLQSCNNQMRLKSTSSGNFNGSATPRSTGNRTPTQITPTISASEKERPELGKEIGNSGRLSSRSTDGSICGGGLTPKEHLLPPNGYNSSASIVRGYNSPNGGGNVKLLTSVKHEQIIKHEPDSEYSCNETKFKSDSSTNPTIIKQEHLILKQDYKPSDLSEKSSLCSPNNLAIEPKPRRKRSTSSSSSSYKEKKRKKEKDIGIGTLTENDKLVDSVTLVKDKEVLNESLKSPRESISMDVCLNKANEQGQTQTQVHQILDQQFSPTNHDRLHVENKLQQQNVDKSNNNCRKLANNVSKTASPAHSQNANNNLNTVASTSMPPPANVGLLPTISPPPSSLTCTKNAPILSPKTILPTASSSPCASASPLTIATSSPALSTTAVGAAATSATAASTTETQVIYRSYFERDDDALSDEFSKDAKFLQEAVHRKHAADREQNTFNQVTLYLEAVVYFLLSGAAMEQHSRSEDAAWTMYKDTLTLIKFISSKFRHLQVSSAANQHENHNKVAILSLRCQSLISLKLFKLKRNFCRQINTICADFFKSGKGDIINGNTPSPISPSNSVGSQGSGSNTPPGKIVPQDIHSALYQQNQYFSYLASSHELWDQADRLVRQGNHTDFFIALDHENGPLTLHSNVYEVFRYVQAGLKKLKDEMLIQ